MSHVPGAAIDAACRRANQAFQPQPAWTQALSRAMRKGADHWGAFERPLAMKEPPMDALHHLLATRPSLRLTLSYLSNRGQTLA